MSLLQMNLLSCNGIAAHIGDSRQRLLELLPELLLAQSFGAGDAVAPTSNCKVRAVTHELTSPSPFC